MEITITINAPELAHAIETLAIAVGCASDKMGAAGLPLGPIIKETANQVANEPINVTAPAIDESGSNLSESGQVTYPIEEKRKVFGEFAKTHGKDAAKSILALFEVSKVTELTDAQYEKALVKMKAVK